MSAFIKAISYYLPEKQIDNHELSSIFPEWGIEKIAEKIGVSSRHIAAEDEFASDMAVKAAEKLFAENGILSDGIDFILYCTQSPDYFLPTTACIIQERLKIPSTAGALDYNLGCSGYVYGLALAKGLIVAGIAKNILLITSETYSKFILPGDKGNRTIFGDAAAATLVSNNGLALIGEFELGTDGSGAGNLMVKEGGLRYRVKTPESRTDEYGNEQSAAGLYMNGPEIFSFTSAKVPVLVAETLRKNNLEKTDISLFVMHQANRYMLEHLRKKLSISVEQFYIYMEAVGNTVSSSIPIALFKAMQEKLPKNDKWLLAGFGVGYSWGGTVLYFS